jgi:hypothetical protein
MPSQALETATADYSPVPNSVVASTNATIVGSNTYDTEPNGEPIPALEGWSLFQCSQAVPSASCSVTARAHLKELYAIISSHNIGLDKWCSTDCEAAIEHLLASTRDKLGVILEFSKRALRIHGFKGGSRHGSCSMHEPLAYQILIRELLCCAFLFIRIAV